MREEFEQRDLDLVEEAKLQEHDFQIALHMAQGRFPGCPHRHEDGEGPARCDANEMRVCCLGLREPCELFGEILEEWRLEYEAIDKADAVRRLSESLQR